MFRFRLRFVVTTHSCTLNTPTTALHKTRIEETNKIITAQSSSTHTPFLRAHSTKEQLKTRFDNRKLFEKGSLNKQLDEDDDDDDVRRSSVCSSRTHSRTTRVSVANLPPAAAERNLLESISPRSLMGLFSDATPPKIVYQLHRRVQKGSCVQMSARSILVTSCSTTAPRKNLSNPCWHR